MSMIVPFGCMSSVEDAAAAKRKEIMERLRRGEVVTVNPSGQIAVPGQQPTSNNGNTNSTPGLTVPAGKLASY